MALPARSTVDVELQLSHTGEGPATASERTAGNNNMWTASAHIITAVIGSVLLSLGWDIAQLGWVVGPSVMLIFAFATYYTSSLLADCYCSGDRQCNYTYMDAVNANLGRIKAKLCGFLQYVNIIGIAIGYTILASISMSGISRSTTCLKLKEHSGNPSKTCRTLYMIIFGVAEIFISQIPDLDKVSWLCALAAATSLTYSAIGISLGIAQVIATNGGVQGSLGVVSHTDRLWRTLQALGDIAFAYTYTHMLVEIQDSIPSSQAHVAMRRANMLASAINTVFSLLCGAVSYAALGDAVPDNLLDGIRTYHADSWLLDVANAAAVVHLAIAYQLGWQPLFALVEQRAQERRWPLSGAAVDVPLYVHGGGRRTYKLNLFRLTCRAALVAATTAASVLLPAPLLKNVLGFLGAICFWPLTVYFPVEMYVVQKQVPRWSARWVCLRMLSLACLAVTVAAGVGYIAGMIVAS